MTEAPAETFQPRWYTPAWRHRTAVALLFLTVCLTYRHALEHPARSDQWSFLLDTVRQDSFLPLFAHTWSWNRTRVVSPGDYPLFRPGLFFVLSAEKVLFGARFIWWQTVGLALHCAVVGCLLRLLLLIHRFSPPAASPIARLRLALAYIVAFFFAVHLNAMELVSWCHIHGYVVYLLLIVGGWLLLFQDIIGPAQKGVRLHFSPVLSTTLSPQNVGKMEPDPFLSRWRRYGAAWILTLLAAFTYETGAAYAVCLGGVLALAWARQGQIRRAILVFALFASILPLFVGVDWWDRESRPAGQPDITEGTVLSNARLEPTADHARRYLAFTLCQPFFPSCSNWHFEDRLNIPEAISDPETFSRPEPILFCSCAVVLAGVGLAGIQVYRFSSQNLRHGFPLFLLLPVCLILLHMTIIVLGRMNLRADQEILPRQSYYAYTPFLCLLVCLFYLWALAPLPAAGGTRWGLTGLAGGLLILSLFSAVKMDSMNRLIRGNFSGFSHTTSFLQAVIDEHRDEPGFSLSFDPDLFYCQPVYHGLVMHEILFARYINYRDPTHVVCARGREWYVLTRAEYEQSHGGPKYRELGTFVGIEGNALCLFRDEEGTYAMSAWEKRFRTTLKLTYPELVRR